MNLILLLESVLVAAAALLNARREYRKHGRLTLVGLFLVCLMLFLPNMLIHYAITYSVPDTPVEWAAVVVAATGLALCLLGIGAFRSFSKVMCLDAGTLARSGPYRWGRNPQYVGWLIFLTGFTLTGWSGWCLPALVVVAVSLHLLVRVEEEHLRRVCGDPYAEFCHRTPRYFGRGIAD